MRGDTSVWIITDERDGRILGVFFDFDTAKQWREPEHPETDIYWRLADSDSYFAPDQRHLRLQSYAVIDPLVMQMRQHARRLGWRVERGICSGYATYQDPCYILVAPNGQHFNGKDFDDTTYGYDAGDATEDDAWKRLPPNFQDWTQ